MDELLTMSGKEVSRLEVMQRLKEKSLNQREAAQLVGADPETQGIVRRRRPAEGRGAAPRRDPEVLESDLEPETVCRPA